MVSGTQRQACQDLIRIGTYVRRRGARGLKWVAVVVAAAAGVAVAVAVDGVPCAARNED